MPRKPKSKPSGWAKQVVSTMSPEDVRHWLKRLGVQVPTDTRTPIERMVDAATGKDKDPQ